MEGPSLTNLMENGVSLFQEISEFIKETYVKPADCEGVESLETPVEEIVETCEMYGRMASLMDAIFSKFYAPRVTVTDELLTSLKEELFLAMQMWEKMQLSLTPKWHTLLDHGWKILATVGGFADMLEDRIEHHHQRRFRDDARLIRVRNQDQVKKSQAKFQNARVIAGVMKIQEQVKENAKRKQNKLVTLGDERATEKKVKRTEKREVTVDWAKQLDDNKVLLEPQAAVVQEYKMKVEEKQKASEVQNSS
jgi:hypothetical protein